MTRDLTEVEFRDLLRANGLTLDDKAFVAAFAGALHLKAEVAKIADYLANSL